MTLAGSCHCGAVRIAVPSPPGWLGSCNCSSCTKLGWLLAYYPDDGSVRVEGETVPYIWGDRMIRIQAHARMSPGHSARESCPVCGCGTHWDSTGESHGKVGVNARLLDGFAVDHGRFLFRGEPLEVLYLDNAG